jgi:hypothetical protein
MSAFGGKVDMAGLSAAHAPSMPPRGFAIHSRFEGVEQRHDVPHCGPVDRFRRPAPQLGEPRIGTRISILASGRMLKIELAMLETSATRRGFLIVVIDWV